MKTEKRRQHCCLVGVLAICLTATTIGCRKDEPIRRLTMPLDQTGIVETLPKFRSIAAMTTQGQSTWFVKIAAPVGVVNEVAGPVRELIKTIAFDQAGEPEFPLPDKWWITRTHPDRFMTVMIPMQSGDPAEVAFTRLSGGQDLLMNVNRWRRQISLPPVENVDSQLESIESPGGEWKIFDQTGLWNPGAPMGGGGPSAGSSAPPAESSPETTAPAIASEIPTPKDFTRDPDSAFVVASFRRETDEGKVRLAVSELPAELNSWETSIASWVSESEITGLDDAAIEKCSSELAIGGFPARKLDLLLANDESSKAVVGIRIECGRQAVYVKLSGDRRAVAANITAVDFVCESLRLQDGTARDAGATEKEPSDKSKK